MFSRVFARCWGSVLHSLLCSPSPFCVVLVRLMLIEAHSSIEPNPNVALARCYPGEGGSGFRGLGFTDLGVAGWGV